jgi:hypothetical protein
VRYGLTGANCSKGLFRGDVIGYAHPRVFRKGYGDVWRGAMEMTREDLRGELHE